MEIKLNGCIWHRGNVVARVVAEISDVVVANHFNHDLVCVVAEDLEVAVLRGIVPQLRGPVSGSIVDMVCNDELAAGVRSFRKLLLEPVEHHVAFVPLVRGIIIRVKVLGVQGKN